MVDTSEFEDINRSVVDSPPTEVEKNDDKLERYSILDAVADAENGMGTRQSINHTSLVDIGPSAEPIRARELFPTEPEPPLLSTSAKLGTFAHKVAVTAHGCPECKSKTGGNGAKSVCVIGGVEFAVGGWGRYEIEKRRARWDSAREAPCYGGRTYISSSDVAYSICAGAGSQPLKDAAEHLSQSLGAMEDVICDPTGEGLWECLSPASLTETAGQKFHTTLTVPVLTSQDMRDFIANVDLWTSPDDLESLANDATAVAASIGKYADMLPPLKRKTDLPPLPTRMVQTDDNMAVLKLEASMVPYIEGLEKYQAAVAERLDAVAAAIDGVLKKNSTREKRAE